VPAITIVFCYVYRVGGMVVSRTICERYFKVDMAERRVRGLVNRGFEVQVYVDGRPLGICRGHHLEDVERVFSKLK